MKITPESPTDHAAIRRVNTLAFGQPNEADLVDALRDTVQPTISLVAREGEEVVGHIFFSPVTVTAGTVTAGTVGEGTAVWTALALGPMAITPVRQRQGIGSALVAAGLEVCRRRGETVVFVLGHPAFYPRFGFVPASPLGLPCEFAVPEDVFMVAQLTDGSLRRRRGLVRYHPLFGTV
jgi:putative acetyltransferase